MRKLTHLLVLGLGMGLAAGLTACGDDDDNTVPGDTGGTGGTDETGGTGGTTGTTGGTTGTTGGTGGSDVVDACDISRGDREEEILTGDVSGELDPSKVYVLEGNVYVNSGDTLTLPPCTRIEGDGPTKGTLIVTRGGKIVADGEADAPILFTARDEQVAGGWGGVVVLGRAPVSLGADVNIEGMDEDPRHLFGGTNATDDSGILRYVRIEYSGIDLGNGSEINGISLGGVGSGTTLSHIMIKDTLDDCFEWFGGTVDADHLICVNGGDDMFDTDDGYVGTIRFAFGTHGAQSSGDPNGLEWDGTSDTAGEWTTEVTLEHATLCSDANSDFAMVLRRGITGTIDGLVAVGFPTGIDLRDDASGISITNSIIVADRVADDDADFDDDGGVDDEAWFLDGEGNSTDDPGFTAAQCMADPPAAAVLESGLGAFAEGGDWVKGLWTGW